MVTKPKHGRRLIAGRSIRWNAARAQQAYANGWWSRETLVDALRHAASQTPDRVMLIEGKRRIDCATMLDEATDMASALLARAPAGSTISFMLPNWAEAAIIYLGATMAGMVVHPILPSLRERELLHMLPDVDSRIVFVPGQIRNHDYAAMLADVCRNLDHPPEIVVVRDDAAPHTSYAEFLAGPPAANLPNIDPDAVQMVLHTSGTTGSPKGVMHSHNSIGALVRQLGANWLIEPGDRFIVPSPISHIGGSIYAFEAPLLLGVAAILMERWDADECTALIEAEGCTHMAGATPFLEQVLAAAKSRGSRLPSLKAFICGGAAVPPKLIRDAAAYFENAVVTRVYGSTEVPVTTVGVFDRNDVTHASETDGQPGIATVKLISPNGGIGEDGEIYAQGPQMLVGYIHSADEADVFDADGFYRTGDVARWVDGKFLIISGRAKDIIIRKGENISPKEIEDVLLEHPDIAEVAIVGIPYPATGERACAVIVGQLGATPDLKMLSAFLAKQGVAAFKRPESIFVWPSLPRNATGKVLKHEIRATLLAAMQED